MNDYTVVRQVIEGHIAANFTTLPIVYENVGLTDTTAEHIKIIDEGEIVVTPVAMGSDVKMAESEVVIGIFTALGTGTLKARQIASELDALFNDDIAGISFKERAFKTVGEREDSPFYEHNLIVPYVNFYGQNDS